MRAFSYTRASTPQAASAALASAPGGARLMAGGTTLYDLMKLGIEAPAHLIDVTDIPGLRAIALDGDVLHIGALALMSDVATHKRVLRDYPVLAEALSKAASQQLRNMATVGGNLLQRTRCPYFRNGDFYACNKRVPGTGCAAQEGLDRGHAVLGASTVCKAVYPGDWAVALLALDAQLELVGPRGPRMLRVGDLHRLPGTTPHLETTLGADEMIVGIRVPSSRASRASTYHKIRDRESYAFALVSAAVGLDLDAGGVVREVRIALGGVATVPWRAGAAERSLVGQRFDAAAAAAAGIAAFAGAVPGRDNGFKLELGARTVADALIIAAERSRA